MIKRFWAYLRKPLSLRRHLLLASWAIIFLGVFAAIASVMIFVYRTEEAVWESRETDVTRNAAHTVSDFIVQVQDYAAVVALIDADILQSDPQLIIDLLYENDALLEMVRVDQDGQTIAGAFRGDITNPVLNNLFTTAQATWFVQASNGQAYIGDMQISAEDEPYIILSVPAPDDGVVAVRLRMNVLWDVISEIRFGDTGQVYVVNHAGYIIAHPEPKVVLARTDLSNFPEMQALLEISDHLFQGSYQSYTGHAVIGTTMPIPGTNWIVVTEIDRHEAFTTTRNAVFILGSGVLLAGALTSAALGWLIQAMVIRPVQNLQTGAVRIGSGELDVRIQKQRDNEIGQVADTFNQMAAQLEEREAALAQARDEAVAASFFKSRLLANVSHDLMTPLNGILGYADMLREGVYGRLTQKQIDIAGRIFANSQRLISLIRSLLDQARIEAGKLEFELAPFELRDLIESIDSIMGVLAQRKNIIFTTRVEPGMPRTLIGDFARLQQILMNLVGNAVKFTERGTINVRFSADQAANTWSFEVVDTGRGISDEDMRAIFDPFWRVDQSTTRKSEGVGLGLSIVFQLVKAMGGEVYVASQLGQGSTFTVTLPFEHPGETENDPVSGADH